MFLSHAEFDYQAAKRQFSDDYDHVSASKELGSFVNHELAILIEMGYVHVTEFRNDEDCDVTENCDAKNGKTSKNGLNHAQIGAPSNFHAPWSGREQCRQDPCRKAYGIASNRAWQATSSG